MPATISDEAGNGPHNKRQKLTNGIAKAPSRVSTSSRIFAPYRTLGLVSPTDVPFSSVSLGKTTFQITTSIGRSLQTYDLRRGLNLVFITKPQTPATITATLAWRDRVLASWGDGVTVKQFGIWVFKRGKQESALETPIGLNEPVRQIIAFGSWIVGCCSTRLEVWKSLTYEHYTTLLTSSHGNSSGARLLSGGICNVPTLLNKILVGKQDGSVELWNLCTGKLVYTIQPLALDTGAVVTLQPSPALALCAIARADGSIVIHDICADKEIIRLNTRSSTNSSFTSISFRTDGLGAGDDGRKPGIMAAAGTDNGDVTLWDLNDGGRIMGVLREAHNPPSLVRGHVSGGISKIEFLPGQPVLVTSGLDNALKSWIFDETPFSPIPRILHKRDGHAASAGRLLFLPSEADGADAKGKWLLSAGRDRSLWGWSLRRDGQSTELSQGSVRKKVKKLGFSGKGLDKTGSAGFEDLKAPDITCIACSLNRDGGMGASTGGGVVWANTTQREGHANASENSHTGWESIVTGHRGDKYARTWFWGRKKAGRWAFESGDGTEVTSVAITHCGTFALVGSQAGAVDMFNLQSGIHRQRFPAPLTPAQARKLKIKQLGTGEANVMTADMTQKYSSDNSKHAKEVTGLLVDSLNRAVVSCGLDGKIKFWDFMTGVLLYEIDWYPMTAITACRYHRESDLIAVSCDDLSIRVVDIETRKLIRELWGCVGQINDFCFSNDGRWIVAASMDSVIRVWDLPTGNLIDAIRVEGACTALAFSTTGEFLATAHADMVGINLWTNRTLFTHIPTRHISETEILQANQPTASGEGGLGLLEAAFEDVILDDNSPDQYAPTTEQLSQNMTTLSLVPRSRWQTLLNLDVIKERNKPKEPPKAPKKAPFFLPPLGGPKPSLSSEADDERVSAAEQSRITRMERHGAQGEITTLLQAGAKCHEYDPFVNQLKSLSPSAADIEIRSLNPLAVPNEFIAFVRALTTRLKQKLDYELIQAWMSVFLRVHGDVIVHDSELIEELKIWRFEQEKESRRLGSLIGYCSGVVGFLRSGRT